MKPNPPLGFVLMVAALLSAAGFAGWSVLRAGSGNDRAKNSVVQLDLLRGYADEIQKHREAPTRIDDQEIELTLLAKIIENTADQSAISRQALDRIWPQPGRRIGDTPYLRKPTQIILRDVSQSSTVAFLHGLTTADPPLSIDSLRINSPARGRGGTDPSPGPNNNVEKWNYEILVSYILYQPVDGKP